MNSIEDLIQDAKPVRRSPSTGRLILVWTIFSVLFLGLAFLIRQPEKAHTPIILGAHLLLSLIAGAMAIASASPHELGISQRFKGLVFLWPIPVIATVFLIPTPEWWFLTPRCILASIAWTIPGLLVMMFLFRNGFLLRPFHSIMLASIAAASLGALAQNVACVELGGFHRLLSHSIPPALVGAIVLALHRLWMPYLKKVV